MSKRRFNIYISEETANVLKQKFEDETGQVDNLSGAITYLAKKIKKRGKVRSN